MSISKLAGDYSEVFEKIEWLGEGKHWCGFRRGWLEIMPAEDVEGAWDVSWASHKRHHDPFLGTGLYITYLPDVIHDVAYTSLSLYLADTEEQYRKYESELSAKIDRAYSRLQHYVGNRP
jgi:hypothetical protein